MIFLYPTLSHFSTCFYYRHTVYLNLIFFTNTSITYIFMLTLLSFFFFFFFNDTATTEIYTLSLHDALPISMDVVAAGVTTIETSIPSRRSDTRYFNLERGIQALQAIIEMPRPIDAPNAD